MPRVEVRVLEPGDASEIEVLAVSVDEGETVEAGHTVAEILCDKVEMDVEAPVGGAVADISVRPGEVIAPADVLMCIQAPDA